MAPVTPHQILIPEKKLRARITRLAREINAFYAGRPLVVVGVLNGSFIFLADLVRQLKMPLHIEFLSASSYGTGLRSSGRVTLGSRRRLPIRGAEVLLVDDILDTGRTLQVLLKFLHQQRPARLETCFLLRKRARRAQNFRPRFVGFDIPDRFVFGYGLDLADRLRNLPYLGALKTATKRVTSPPPRSRRT